MKLRVSKHTSAKSTNRLKKKIKIRKTVNGTAERPRLCVFRSAKHIYAQIVNDEQHKTILTVTSVKLDQKLDGKSMAKLVGKTIAEASIKKGIKAVVFPTSLAILLPSNF